MTPHADIPADRFASRRRSAGTSPDVARRLARLSRLARLLDSSIRLPGGYRIGLDGLIGLIPGIGDIIAAAISSYIILEGLALRASPGVILRMSANVLIELLVGSIPILGDLFDFAFKANERNVRLLKRHFDR
ncbi:MAG: DUF4112 domain-containing protein [Phycisphaerales bacterium]|nr:DUF4112 domain-containing protein [Phycisphaerales bacterium]